MLARRTFLAGAGAMALGLRARSLTAWAGSAAPTLIFINGEVRLLDHRDRTVQALAIADGRVMAVGTTAEIQRLADAKTRVVDLAGRTLLPGINDSHLHAEYWGLGRPPFSLNVTYPAVRSIADVARVVGEAVRTKRAGAWIVGWGYDPQYFAERRAPTRADLDAVSPDHPVMLTEFSGHAVWINTKAMTLAGITRDSVPPPGGLVIKDAAGEPTGVLMEGATGLVRRVVPPSSIEEREGAIVAALREMAALGITSFTEPGVTAESVKIVAGLAERGALTARANVLHGSPRSLQAFREWIEARPGLARTNSRWLRVAGIKVYADGIPTINKTALLHEPYLGGGNGSLTIDGATPAARAAALTEMIRLAHAGGWQIGTHATGDATIDIVVDAYLAAQRAHPRADARHYIIHGDLIPPKTLATMARAGIGANFNASIKYLIADGQMSSIGAQRATYEWPYRSALDAGVHVASSSDAPVTDGDWRQGVATCVLREGKQTKQVSGPEQRISLTEALRSYTTAGAWQDGAEAWKGTLEVGMAADACVLGARLSDIDLHDFPKVPVTMTVVDGKVVFEA